jgi:hypothetical protein
MFWQRVEFRKHIAAVSMNRQIHAKNEVEINLGSNSDATIWIKIAIICFTAAIRVDRMSTSQTRDLALDLSPSAYDIRTLHGSTLELRMGI